jgi:hypothetical protein
VLEQRLLPALDVYFREVDNLQARAIEELWNGQCLHITAVVRRGGGNARHPGVVTLLQAIAPRRANDRSVDGKRPGEVSPQVLRE